MQKVGQKGWASDFWPGPPVGGPIEGILNVRGREGGGGEEEEEEKEEKEEEKEKVGSEEKQNLHLGVRKKIHLSFGIP